MNKDKIIEKAKDRDFEKEFGTSENSEEDSRELDLKKGAARARRGARSFGNRASSFGEKTRGTLGRKSSSQKLGGSFLKTARKLDTAKSAFKRNFGEPKGLGLETTGEMFESSDVEPGSDFDADFFGDSSSGKKQEKSGFDMELGFDMDL